MTTRFTTGTRNKNRPEVRKKSNTEKNTMINVLSQLPGAGVGFVVGAFTPAVGRKIKALFVKETSAAKAAVEKKL
jgi:hypothetical protein